MMKLIIVLFLAFLGMVCKAEEEENENRFKEFIEFHNEMSTGICKPEEICSDKLKAVLDCQSLLNDVDEQTKEHLKKFEELVSSVITFTIYGHHWTKLPA